MKQAIVGWDIGGAHVKAALIDEEGRVIDVALHPCPLWLGMQYLQKAVRSIMRSFSVSRLCHALTMTGELVDLFDNRDQGVDQILRCMSELLGDDKILVYAGQRGFLMADQLSVTDYADVASMNWLASASLAARYQANGLFVDVGSTTTDLLLLRNGVVDALGLTDYQRLVSSELVYTGIVRTAIMAVAQRAVFNGQSMGLMAEYFATMADVYRITGDLNEAHDHTDTADGGPKTIDASGLRLSRMTGYEFRKDDWSLWVEFAKQLKDIQKQTIADVCQLHLNRLDSEKPLSIIGAGIGRFLVEEIAKDTGYSYLDFSRLINQNGDNSVSIESADCAPAVAVAYLAAEFCFYEPLL